MILCGTHTTTYTYDAPVALDMHAVRLQPRTGGGQTLRRFDLQVAPTPTARTQTIDAEGNAAHLFWFLGQTRQLTFESRFEVECACDNPFDFIPSPAASLPPQLPPDERELFRLHTKCAPAAEIAQQAQTLATGCDGSALGFTVVANAWIHENVKSTVRHCGAPLSPEKTLADRRGACRDMSVLLIALCRARGLPARFVSGYQYKEDSEPAQHDLHAWAEVWIPGGGWRGFDPSQGLAVAGRHIALAASASHALAAPVTGSFHGNVVARQPTHLIRLSEFR